MSRSDVAERLVDCAAWPINHAYYHGQVRGRGRLERAFTCRVPMWASKRALRAAFKIHNDAACDCACRHGWWG